MKRQHFTKNPFKIIGEFANAIKLLSINFEPLLESLPKDRITIIRGKDDKLCCDNQAAESLRSKGITVIDAEGGHNWSEGIEKALGELF